jgi:predicted phage terminase large subunit-like protein
MIGEPPELLHKEFPERFFLGARIDDNPHLRRDEYLAALSNLDPVRRRQLLNGDWEVAPSGNLFRREWFQIVEEWPREVSGIVRAWDDAATRDGGDWTVGVLMARARTGIFYIINVVRIQGSPLDVERLKAQTAKIDAELTGGRAVILLQQEPGAAGKSFIDSQKRGPLCGYNVRHENPTGDKYTRALPMSSAAEAGNIKLVQGRWNKDFVEELEQAGPDPKLYDHDDQWDAGASAFNHLASNQSEFGWRSVRELEEEEEPYDPRFPEDSPYLRKNKRPELGALRKGGRFSKI